MMLARVIAFRSGFFARNVRALRHMALETGEQAAAHGAFASKRDVRRARGSRHRRAERKREYRNDRNRRA
jgi:hypothetical protein